MLIHLFVGKKNLLGKSAKLFNAHPSHGCFRLKTTFRPAVSHNHRPKIDGWTSIIKFDPCFFVCYLDVEPYRGIFFPSDSRVQRIWKSIGVLFFKVSTCHTSTNHTSLTFSDIRGKVLLKDVDLIFLRQMAGSTSVKITMNPKQFLYPMLGSHTRAAASFSI